MPHTTPSFKEDQISQIPAVMLLSNLGYTYLTPAEVNSLRGGKSAEVLLPEVLSAQLRKLNKIIHKGSELEFTESNIQTAIQSLRGHSAENLSEANAKIHELLTLGRSMTQLVDGSSKSFNLRYIDFDDISNNVFHVTEEFSVTRSGAANHRRPDVILFCNGIPLCVIECKRPDLKDAIDEAISQQLRNQDKDEIPQLFGFAQLLLAVSKNEAKYATALTPTKFWAIWKEQQTAELQQVVNTLPDPEVMDKIFDAEGEHIKRSKANRKYMEELIAGTRKVTPQDKLLYFVARPERLLQMMQRYNVFDNKIRKIARYQQYFCVEKILGRVRNLNASGKREGGVVWHTQGSGKSLTMVMLAMGLALEPNLQEHKVLLVTDRVALDAQIFKTFSNCDIEPIRATSGKDLAKLINGHESQVITTVLDKFENAVDRHLTKNENPNVFVLVDEAHRSQSGVGINSYGEMHSKMRIALPNACFIGFTGTPLMKKEKTTANTFGGIIDQYTIAQAVADKAVLPLLYEGRHVNMKVDRESIDGWFDRITKDKTAEYRENLKKKFSTTEQVNKAEQRIMSIAWDISEHFRENWQGTGRKAQLVAPDKATAILYKKYLDEFGHVTSEVMISPPDDRKSHTEKSEAAKSVFDFWEEMMKRFVNELGYKRDVLDAFQNHTRPEIIIVVDMLLTGFDEPKNTVLYLTRKMEGHTLLQAIARVNRLHTGKEFGFVVDYHGVLTEVGDALDLYGQLGDYDTEELEDIATTFTALSREIENLPTKHAHLWEIFQPIENKKDEEAFEVLLADDELRDNFKERLSKYARTLAIAISSVKFQKSTPKAKIKEYKADLRFFMKLRTSIGRRYSDEVDFKEYENRIQNLVNTYVGVGVVEQVAKLVDIFNEEEFEKELEKAGSVASKADTIASRTKKTIEVKMPEDPQLYMQFSELLEQAILDFKEQRIDDIKYLSEMKKISKQVVDGSAGDEPDALKDKPAASAFYRAALNVLETKETTQDIESISVDIGMKVDEVVKSHLKVRWTETDDIAKLIEGEVDDYLFDLSEELELSLSVEEIDEILKRCIDSAKARYATVYE